MSNHETDGVAFFFGVLFLLCAAAAIALRTVPIGESADGGVAVAAAVVLLIAGAIGIGGSLRNRHRRGRADAGAGDDPAIGEDTLAIDDEDPSSESQPPKTWTT